MKTKILIAAIIMAFVTMAATPIANGFDFVRSHRQGKGATITWAYTTPGAVSFALQRTCEDPNDEYSQWYPVTTIQSNSSRSYKHTDDNPGLGYVNYRVVALMNDGSTATSEITTIRINSH